MALRAYNHVIIYSLSTFHIEQPSKSNLMLSALAVSSCVMYEERKDL